MRLINQYYSRATIDQKCDCVASIDLDFYKAIRKKLGQLEDIEDGVGIDLIALLSAKSVYVATFVYWRWNSRDKQQCKKDDVGAIEEKQIEKKCGFSIDFINKEIVIIECAIVGDFGYGTKITKLKLEDYGKTWALTKGELENDK